FVYCEEDYAVIDNDGRERPTGRGWDSMLIPLIFHGQPNAHVPTVLVRKDVFLKEGGFNPALEHGESWELFARIASKHPIHCIPQRLAKQRLHPGQMTRDLRSKADAYHRFHNCLQELWSQDITKRAILVEDTARVYADLGKHF